MSYMYSIKRYMAIILSVVFLLGSITTAYAQPSMIGTHEVVAEQQMNVDRDALLAMLDEIERWRGADSGNVAGAYSP